MRQILSIYDRGDPPCGHVRQVLSDRLDQVRTQIAELVTLEAHLETLLAHAKQSEPTVHDGSSVCWILETEPRQTRPTPTPSPPTAGSRTPSSA